MYQPGLPLEILTQRSLQVLTVAVMVCDNEGWISQRSVEYRRKHGMSAHDFYTGTAWGRTLYEAQRSWEAS